MSDLRLVGVWVEKGLKERVERLARDRGLSVSEVGRLALTGLVASEGARLR